MTSTPTSGLSRPSQTRTADDLRRASSRSMSRVFVANTNPSSGLDAGSPGWTMARQGSGGKLELCRDGGGGGGGALRQSRALWPLPPQETHLRGSLQEEAKWPLPKQRKHLPCILILKSMERWARGPVVGGRLEFGCGLVLAERRLRLERTVTHPCESMVSSLPICLGKRRSCIRLGAMCVAVARSECSPTAAVVRQFGEGGAAVNAAATGGNPTDSQLSRSEPVWWIWVGECTDLRCGIARWQI